ncbi:MAG: hypothetical protein H7246_02415, partial [Phycisphaerae bacterium]|nr:hypothetical protein [Saprospiraceae bacterium]
LPSIVLEPRYNADSDHSNPDLSRNVYPITRPEDFFDLLQDRLHTVVENLLFQGDHRFTIILNALNRREYKKINRKEDVDLIYAGINKQRELLQSWGGIKPVLEESWTMLSETMLDSKRAIVGAGLYNKFQAGEYGLKDIAISSLKSYFKISPQNGDEAILNSWLCEKTILDAYFDLENDLYVSIPLIGFGDIDGIAHIVFKKKWEDQVRNKQNLWAVLRNFTMEYDGKFLDWAVVGDNMEKTSSIKEFLDLVQKDDFYEKKNKNPLLKELDLLSYYRRHDAYYRLRFKLSDGVPGKIYQLYIVHSIVSILVDSYAHNVSAHSLTTLAWWFRQRAKRFREPDVDWEQVFDLLERDELNSATIEQLREILAMYNPNSHKDSVGEEGSHLRKEDGDKMISYPGHLSREIYPMFQFLMEKGAYWSGITRNMNVGGMVSSLYNILWHDFMQNPLYIGTIAKTEDIQHVRLRIVVYEPTTISMSAPSDPEQPVRKRIVHDGILAEVDLLRPQAEGVGEEDNSDEPRSVFVREGENLKSLKKPLKNIRIFLPGGVVGKHALFTMLENEIRNVKHYNRRELESLREQGLTLSIGVQPCSLPASGQQELYRLSIWIDAPSRLLTDDTAEHVVLKKWKSLEGELFDSGIAPKLGGTYQDKVCAAMLFNNSFSSVQNGFDSIHRPTDRDTERDRLYYPWALPACSLADEQGARVEQHEDFEFIRDKGRLPPLMQDDKITENPNRNAVLRNLIKGFPKEGFLKKIFHVWKGQNLLNAAEVSNLEDENPARFRIVHLPLETTDFEEQFVALRRKCGVIRIINDGKFSSNDVDIDSGEKDMSELRLFRDACIHWLAIWIGKPVCVLKFLKDSNSHRMFVLDNSTNGQPKFYDFSANDFLLPDKKAFLASYDQIATESPIENILEVAHKGDAYGLPEADVMWYRRHGVYKKYFLEEIKGENEEKKQLLKDLRALEFFETLLTRICIFDNRIYHRIRSEKDRGRDDFFRHRLKLVVKNEATDDDRINPEWLKSWEQERTDFIPTCHFLVIHLSFIERILQKKHKKEGDVGLFIQKEIVSAMPNGKVPDNFMLVITTGRGRNDWWKYLEKDPYKDYARFTIFRPVESLITAVERSVSIHDDVELKFRLVKILFGS